MSDFKIRIHLATPLFEKTNISKHPIMLDALLARIKLGRQGISKTPAELNPDNLVFAELPIERVGKCYLCSAEAAETDDGRGIMNDDSGILHSDEGDEQADTAGDAVLQVLRDSVDDRLSELEEREDNEQDTFEENRGQSDLEGVLRSSELTEADRIGKIRIKAEACGKGYGITVKESHKERRQSGRDGCRDENAAAVHDRTEDIRVNRQNVRHCKECSETGDNLGLHVCSVLLKVEQLFHMKHPPHKMMHEIP